MKKTLLAASAAGLLVLGSAAAHANPSSIFSDDADQYVDSNANASSYFGDARSVSESYNSPVSAVSYTVLNNTAADNNASTGSSYWHSGSVNQDTGDVSWEGSSMGNFAGLNAQAANTAQAGAAQANSTVTANAQASFNFD